MELLTKVELDKGITKADERVSYLKEKLDEPDAKAFYTNGIDSKFNKLSEDVYISRRIEAYTNYLLKGEMEEKEKGFSTLTDEQYNKSEAPRRFVAKGEGLSEEDVMKQADKLRTNGIKYKSNNIKITKTLINEDSELGAILRDYQPLRETLSSELQKIKSGQATKYILHKSYSPIGLRVSKGKKVSLERPKIVTKIQKQNTIKVKGTTKIAILKPLSFRMIREHLGEVNSDMLLSIKYKKGLDYLRPNPTKPASLDIDYIDYGNWEVVKILLSMYHLKEQGSRVELDEIIIVADINKALEAIKLNANDMDIIEKYNSGYSITDLSKELGLNKSSVSRKIDKICKLIAKQMS